MKHHILIASEQLWPNLLGLAALIKRDSGVQSLYIIHTSDKQRSENPAKKIKRLSSEMQPGLHAHLIPTNLTSQEVSSVVRSILNDPSKKNAEWSINVTGGTKTMFAGLAPWARLPNVEAFYREVTGAWFQLKPSKDNDIQLLECEEWAEAKTAKVNLPVGTLATSQANHPPKTNWKHKEPMEMDIACILKEGVANEWNWRDLYQKFPTLSSPQAGVAFESFFAALIKACGIENTLLNLEMFHENHAQQEFDVILSTGQNLVIFDLKLTNTEQDAVINQISRLGEDRRSLGGLNAVAIAIRPNWLRDDTRTAIAKSHQVQIWDQDDMPNLISKLLQITEFGEITEEHSLWSAHLILKNSGKQGKRIFTRSQALLNINAPMESCFGWLNISPYHQECIKKGKKGAVIDLGGKFLVRASANLPGWKNQPELPLHLPEGVKVHWFNHSKNSNTSTAILSSSTEAKQSLKNHLHDLLNLASNTSPDQHIDN